MKRINDSMKLYIDLLVEQQSGIHGNSFSSVVNVVPEPKPIVQSENVSDYKGKIWDCDDKTERVYNCV